MTYDGLGRMATRHYPIEDSGAKTSWAYNKDGSIATVTDPRGAITAFTYENSSGVPKRPLVTKIEYTPQSGGVDTPDVNFTFDNAGNRTNMETVGVTNTAYTFDELSQLTSENVTFSALSGNNYGASYTYEPGGALRSLTASEQLSGSSATTQEIDYENDIAGRVVVAKGAAFGTHSNGPYVNNIQYRAFGQLKEIDYKATSTETSAVKIDYDNALRVSHFEATVPGSTTSFVMKANFAYNADGRTASKTDQLNSGWSRTMKYDFAGRMTSAVFGGPYTEAVTYDGFSQMDNRSGQYWGQDMSTFSGIGVDGRMQSGAPTYDAAGNLKVFYREDENHEPDLHNHQDATFDAAGRKTKTYDYFRDSNDSVKQTIEEYAFDGDGHPVIEKLGSAVDGICCVTTGLTATTHGYQVWSSVLGKSLINLDASGNKKDVNVYAGGMHVATMGYNGSDAVILPIADPVTGTLAHVSSASGAAITEEREPLGQTIALTNPGVPAVPPSTAPLNKGDAGDPVWQCIVEQNKTGYDKQIQPCFVDLGIWDYQKNIPPSSPGEVHRMPNGGDESGRSPSLSLGLAKQLLTFTAKRGSGSGRGDDPQLPVIPPTTVDVAIRGLDAAERTIDDIGAENEGGGNGPSIQRHISNRHIIDSRFIRAYAAASVIATGGGNCGTSFGKYAGEALDYFFSKTVADVVRDNYGQITDKTGIQMTSSNENFQDGKGVIKYTGYQRITINTEGPFLNSFSKANKSDFGGYNHGTLQSQILQILHELGHLVYKNGSPILQPDGDGKRTADGKMSLSVANTGEIVGNCGAEIDSLVKAIESKSK